MCDVETNVDGTFKNLNYKKDVEYVIYIARFLMTPVGIWPLSRDDTFFDKLKIFVQTGSLFCLMCFLLIPHVIYTLFDVEDLSRFMKVIAAQVFSLLAIIKFLTVMIRKKEIRYCLKEIEAQYKEVECEEDRLVMTRSAKIGRLFTVTYLGLTYGGALPYHIILPLVAERVVKQDNTTQLPLPYLSDYVFFVIEDSPIFEIVFVTQILTSTIILSTNTGIYSLIATCVMHSSCLFEVVCRQIETILEYKSSEIRVRLGVIIKTHTKAIKFAEMIENTLNIVFLSEMVGCTIIICFLEYGVLKEFEDGNKLGTVTYFVLMTSLLVNVFIISFIGDRLKGASEKVGKTLYFVDWCEFPTEVVKDMIFILIRANRPSNLTAGKLFDLSLQGFSDVCKTSAAYLNFIRTVVT